MKLDKKTLASRILLIVVCFAVACGCYLKMNESYDPLARYSYATEENREIILEYLSSDDINYMINQQIEPEKFLDFIAIEGFNIRNTNLYYTAKTCQDADNEYIVNFVNRYRSNISSSTFNDMVTYYSYNDLTTFFETEQVLNEDLHLITNPEQTMLLLDSNHSVYKYVPTSLTTFSNITVQETITKNLQSLLDSYSKTMASSLTFANGYLSYEEVLNKYTMMEEKYGDNIAYFMNKAGQDEIQLGYTIVLSQAQDWIDMCQQANVFESYDYQTMMDDKQYSTATIEWLEENAYRYGFVIRYPEGKEDQTNHIFQPYVLRYVGKKNAKKLQKNHQCLEEAGLTKIE